MALPIVYHWRNLFVRRTTTVLTVLVVGAVVGTLTWVLGFAMALQDSLAVAADPHKLLVLQRSAISETNSAISPEEFNRLSQLTGVARDPNTQEPLISPELVWQTQLFRKQDKGGRANVALRGVTDKAFAVHRNVRLLGPGLDTGQPQVLVGVSAARQFAGLEIGDKLQLGFGDNREFTVVGQFSADRGPMESEIWLYLPQMQSAYNRSGYSSAAIRLESSDPNQAKAAIEQIRGPAIELTARTEADYWSEQAGNIRIYQTVCYVLVAMMALAAVFAIANTMFAAVDGRAREIAMLRTVGFAPAHVLTGFVLEALLLSLLGGVAGLLGCWAWLALAGNTKDMFGANTFTSLAFEIRLTWLTLLFSLLGVLLIGALGALFPASRAARTQVVSSLRQA